MEHKFELGWRLKCKVTGFTGIAMGRLEYLNGCIQYGLKPLVEIRDGKQIYPENTYLDEGQLEIVDEGVNPNKSYKQEGGAENSSPIQKHNL